jgi:hypothetical protein
MAPEDDINRREFLASSATGVAAFTIKTQFQICAMRTVGDPVMYFSKHTGQFISMHLQGVDLNTPMPTPGGPRPSNVAVGHDSLPRMPAG